MAIEIANDSNIKDILSSNDKVIVKFYANWCGSCRMFKPKYKRLSGDERFEAVTFLDVNAEESPEIRKMAGVDNLPFFAVFKNGELVEGRPTSKEDSVVELLGMLN